MDKRLCNLKLNAITILDSLTVYHSHALKDFSKTFGLVELAKGYFPHKFNTDENQHYADHIHTKYTMDTISGKKKTEKSLMNGVKQKKEKHLTIKKKCIDIVKAMLIY